jgi:hypothetical protein
VFVVSAADYVAFFMVFNLQILPGLFLSLVVNF